MRILAVEYQLKLHAHLSGTVEGPAQVDMTENAQASRPVSAKCEDACVGGIYLPHATRCS